MSLLSKEAILAAQDLPSEDVEVPEWGGTVRVRGLDGKGRDEYFMSQAVIRGGAGSGVQGRVPAVGADR